MTPASPNSSKALIYAAKGKRLLEWKINHNEKYSTTGEPASPFTNVPDLCSCLIDSSLLDFNPPKTTHALGQMDLT